MPLRQVEYGVAGGHNGAKGQQWRKEDLRVRVLISLEPWQALRCFEILKFKRAGLIPMSLIQESRFITAADSNFPSARPSASSCERFMTLPMSALPVAPVSAMACSMIANNSVSLNAAGR